MAITPETQTDGDRYIVYRIQRAIRIASSYVPWKSQCLAQAIAATIMLRLRRIEGTVYLGIAKKEDDQAVAHAWLRSGKTIDTGARGREEHSVVSTFAFGAVQRNM